MVKVKVYVPDDVIGGVPPTVISEEVNPTDVTVPALPLALIV